MTDEEAEAFVEAFRVKYGDGKPWSDVHLMEHAFWDSDALFMFATQWSEANAKPCIVATEMNDVCLRIGIDATHRMIDDECGYVENERLVAGGQDGFPPVEVDWDSGEVRDVSDNEVG